MNGLSYNPFPLLYPAKGISPGSDEKLPAPGENFSPFSSNNDRYNAPPSQNPEIVTDVLNDAFCKSDINGLSSGLPRSISAADKRNILDAILRDQGLSIGRNSFWSIIEDLKTAMADLAGIQNSDFRPFLRYNFDRCYRNNIHGEMVTLDVPGADPIQCVRKFNCGNPLCFWCAARKRKKIALEYLDIIRQCAEKYGMTKVWSFIFTLPQAIENPSEVLQKEYQKGIIRVIKKVFGLKTRDNIGIIIARHMAGDSDLMRPRVHWHVIVLPMVMKKDIGPVLTNIETVNLEALRREWNNVLFLDNEAICPEVKFFKTGSDTDLKKLSHRLRYDLRSFAIDIENQVVRKLDDVPVLIIKKNSVDGFSWSAVAVKDYAARANLLMKKTLVQPFGWLRQRKKYFELGYFEYPMVSKQLDIISKDACEIEIIRETYFDRALKKVVIRRAVMCYYLGQTFEVGKDIKFY